MENWVVRGRGYETRPARDTVTEVGLGRFQLIDSDDDCDDGENRLHGKYGERSPCTVRLIDASSDEWDGRSTSMSIW